MATALLVELRRKAGTFDADQTLFYPRSHWSHIDGKPSTFNPAPHDSTHDAHNDERYLSKDFPYSLDTHITELNNHSLREVFEDGNKIPSLSNPTLFTYSNATYVYNDGWLILISGSTNTYWQIGKTGLSLPIGKIYQRFDYQYLSDVSYTIQTFINSPVISYSLSSQTSLDIREVSNIYNNDTLKTSAYILTSKTPILSNRQYKIKDWFLIDLTSLGIDTLTVSQMDYWYGVYQELKKINMDDIVEGTTYKKVTQTEKDTWNNKMDAGENPLFDTSDADFAIGARSLKNRLQSHSTGTEIRFFNTLNQYAKIAVNDVMLNDNTNSLITLLNGKVATTREIVGIPLSNDITQSALKAALAYTAGDVGAQAQSDKLTSLANIGSSLGIVRKYAVDGFDIVSPDTIGTINNITMNGSANQSPTFYAPTIAGTDDYILYSNGSGAPSWKGHWGYISNRVSTSITLTLTSYGHKAFFPFDGTGVRTVTIPANSSEAFPIGTEFTFINTSTGTTTLSCSSGVTINGSSANYNLSVQYKMLKLIKISTDAWITALSN